jgi:hypothetical protein
MSKDDSGARKPASHRRARGRSNNRSKADAKALAAVSRAITRCPLSDDVRPYVTALPQDCQTGLRAGFVHPDAEEVLRCCRRKAASAAKLTETIIREAYDSILRRRRNKANIRRIEQEAPAALQEALASITRRCAGDDRDAILVWEKVAKCHPNDPLGEYTKTEIGRARRDVTVERERSDTTGAGAGHHDDSQIRRLAMERLGKELGLSDGQLLKLELGCYDPDGTILLEGHPRPITLSSATVTALGEWLEIRRPGPGPLFPPALSRRRREFALGGDSEQFWNEVVGPNDGVMQLEFEDEIRTFCYARLSADLRNVMAAIIVTVGRYDWSEQFVETLVSNGQMDGPNSPRSEQETQAAWQQIEIEWNRWEADHCDVSDKIVQTEKPI